ncbi:MAG: NUDIX domain-containing protein [Sporomusaceae bacterium]|nr:NUDIX domain-containing protein [Sporomusaceae bacterium]
MILAERYDLFLVDLDGVIYFENQLVPGSQEAIARLRSMGKKLYFFTNDPGISRQAVCEKLNCLGIPAVLAECITSGWTAAFYLVPNRVSCAYVMSDQSETDIRGAEQGRLDVILVARQQASRDGYREDYKPKAVIGSLMELFCSVNCCGAQEHSTYFWPDTIEPGVAGVVFNEQHQILLVKRVDNGLWGLPSGHVEKAESVAHAICREILEETGLIVTAEKLVGVYSDPETQVFRYPSGKVTHFITLSFLCRIKGGTLQADCKEISEANFFDMDNLPLNLMKMNPYWLADALAKSAAAWVR